MSNDERFQEIKEKEIKRLTTPLNYPKGIFSYNKIPKDCEGQPARKRLWDNRYILEPKPGLLSDDEILIYASESKQASKIRLKRGIGNILDKKNVYENYTTIPIFLVSGLCVSLFIGYRGFQESFSLGLLLISLGVLLIVIGALGYIYIFYIKDYMDPLYKQKLEEQKTISGENLPDDELLSLFYIKEKIAREMIEKRFPAPQITNSKFNEVLNNVKEVVKSQVEILNALTPTEKTKYKIESRENSIKQLISKIDDLTNELILSEKNNFEEVIEEVNSLINSVKEY